ncbi:MAG: alpha-amylase family glycosyl hydrolase [Myxococcota bacterium]|nr:alpha-amylase family glycosyl hydrolase [Myxococcota bacterium]
MSRALPLLLFVWGALCLAACPGGDPVSLYATEPLAPSLSEEGVRDLEHLGPLLVDQGVNFGVWSSAASRIDLLLFDDPEDDQPAQQFPLVRFGQVWNLYVEGVGLGQHYGYVAWGPNWPEHEDWYPGSVHGFLADVDSAGNRFNPNKLLLDPWAKALHRDHDWSRASNASGPARTESTWGAASKSVVVRSDYTWSEAEADWREARASRNLPGHALEDLVVYEVHPKGFTADPSSGVTHPGTFRGLGEKASYLADLGVNVVELLPVHEKPLDGGYWGYNNISFFAPEHTYASDSDPNAVLDEFKGMVDQLHQHGIEVWVDVVYNHTGEGGLWRERIYQDDTSLDPGTDAAWYNYDPHETAGIYSYRGLDNAAWYALDEDGLTYWNNTGVGNQTRPNFTPAHRVILDSLHFYVEELHVDGFRFDLAPVLGEVDGDFNHWSDPAQTILQDVVDDPVLVEHDVRVVAEPWSAGGFYNPVLGQFPAGEGGDLAWGEWNARFRDWWRSFVNQDDWALNASEAGIDGGGTITGSWDLYAHNGRGPTASYNFITIHDGFTMYDLVTYPEKQNGCGPLNPICCDDPTSSWCETDSGEEHNRSRDWGSHPEGEALKRQMMRNFFTAMMISHGTPMLLGGDEWLRTQHGNNNAYSTGADNPFNWFQWGTWQQDPERVRMHDFVRQIIQLRRDHGYALAPPAYGASAPLSWKSAANTDAVDWSGRHLMIHYWDSKAGPQLAILINMERSPVEFTLPEGTAWERLVDTQRWFDFADPDSAADFFDTTGADSNRSHNISVTDGLPLDEPTYLVQDSSIVVLRESPAR